MVGYDRYPSPLQWNSVSSRIDPFQEFIADRAKDVIIGGNAGWSM